MKKRTYFVVALLVILMLSLAACGGSAPAADDGAAAEPAQPAAQPAASGDAAHGQEVFATCAACHGKDGGGVAGLGPNLRTSDFVAGLSDDELVKFIKTGRPVDDPQNTTGVAMPPSGGNPSLSDADLQDVVAFIRSLR